MLSSVMKTAARLGGSSMRGFFKIRRRELREAKGAYEGVRRAVLPNPDIEAYVQPRSLSGKTWAYWFTPRMTNAETMVFGSDEAAEEYLYRVSEAYGKRAERTASRRADSRRTKAAERAAFVNPLKAGDILSAMWGYEQDNASFYRVLKVGKSMAKIVEIGMKYADSAMTEAVPDGESVIGEPISREVGRDGSVNVNSVIRASPWSGFPEMVTGPYHTR